MVTDANSQHQLRVTCLLRHSPILTAVRQLTLLLRSCVHNNLRPGRGVLADDEGLQRQLFFLIQAGRGKMCCFCRWASRRWGYTSRWASRRWGWASRHCVCAWGYTSRWASRHWGRHCACAWGSTSSCRACQRLLGQRNALSKAKSTDGAMRPRQSAHACSIQYGRALAWRARD